MAVPMASFCFDESGKVKTGRVAALKSALMDQGNFFYQKPCSTVPGIELIRTQAARVLGSPELPSFLNEASDLKPNDYGQQVLSAMSQSPLKLNTAVLASLFSPHRQTYLPTCAINSIMNADIHNNPAVPAKMMIQMLTIGVTHTPSGYVLRLPSIKDGFVAVDLSEGLKNATKKIFDSSKADIHAIYGIRRNEENENVLLLPIFDANDALLAAYFQASPFGNRGLERCDIYLDRGATLMRYGIGENSKVHLNPIVISNSSNSMEVAIESMKREASQRRTADENLNYVRIGTKGTGEDHAENIDVDALLKLDLSRLEKDKPYIIGDRSWASETGFPLHLAVVKTSDPSVNPPTYRFASVYFDGKLFKWADIKEILFWPTEVKSHESRLWRVNETGTIVYEPNQAAPV
jgi:hypothetical protein